MLPPSTFLYHVPPAGIVIVLLPRLSPSALRISHEHIPLRVTSYREGMQEVPSSPPHDIPVAPLRSARRAKMSGGSCRASPCFRSHVPTRHPKSVETVGRRHCWAWNKQYLHCADNITLAKRRKAAEGAQGNPGNRCVNGYGPAQTVSIHRERRDSYWAESI